MEKYLKLLKENSDAKYASFSAKLTPNVDPSLFLGVRVPIVRKLAKSLINDEDLETFLNELPHKYFDENMLHCCLISEIKDYEKAIFYINKFLPYVDNWAVCDIMSPKCFKKNKDKLIDEINKWIDGKSTYEIRFGIGMLMGHFLDDDFDKEYLLLPLKIKRNEYYINMMIAWYYATALTKQYSSTIYIIENKLLDKWTHNKTIQKAIESYRISNEQKNYLRSYKIK